MMDESSRGSRRRDTRRGGKAPRRGNPSSGRAPNIDAHRKGGAPRVKHIKATSERPDTTVASRPRRGERSNSDSSNSSETDRAKPLRRADDNAGGDKDEYVRSSEKQSRARRGEDRRSKDKRDSLAQGSKTIRENHIPAGLERQEDEPPTPEDFDGSDLPFAVKAELRGLPKQIADIIAAHLSAAGSLIDIDPQLAFKHAMAARRRAARLPVVREAAAETAYAAGEYSTALNEYRALRRMNGDPNYLPVMADCERALGRPQAALRLLKEAEGAPLDPEQRIEAIMVESGVRDDLGQRQEALRLLKAMIVARKGPKFGQARLRYAYADLLERSGQLNAAQEWFAAASKYDEDNLLDTDERVARLEGMVIHFDDETAVTGKSDG